MQVELYLNRLYFFSFTSTIAFFFRHTSPHLSSHPRDVLQVGLCIQRNCYIASNTCTSSRQSLTYRMSHSRARERCAKKDENYCCWMQWRLDMTNRDNLMMMMDGISLATERRFCCDLKVHQHRFSTNSKAAKSNRTIKLFHPLED